ncbi:MAG: hypothetical protein AAGJ82_07740, partial [Bacteroidota bacterium]
LAENGKLSLLGYANQDVPELKKPGQKITTFGYYRLFLYGRDFSTAYPNLDPFTRAYGVGDGYREPMLSFNVLARPNGRAAFGTEMFFFTPYLGQGPQDNTFSVNLGLNFYGNFRTEAGNFGIRAGGIHWYNLSPFTIGVFQILDRFSIFDRTPWEGVNNTDKYSSYFATGATNPGDLRWNNQAFQGLILNGTGLPGDIGFDLFWGKMQPNGGLANAVIDPQQTVPVNQAGYVPSYQGFAGDRRTLPSFVAGGRLSRNFGDNGNLAYNLLYSQTTLDSITKENRNYQVHTLSFDYHIGKANLKGELGASGFESPITEKMWGEALMLRLTLPKEYTFLPLDIQLYQISENFFNENGEINTFANPVLQLYFADGRIIPGQGAVGGSLTLVNQLAHNRRGINLNTGWESEQVKINLGWGLAAELAAISSTVSYVHRINGLAMSRVYNPFPADATQATTFGPYGRQTSFFRGVFETVQTTDLDPATAEPTTRKYYTALDLQAKVKTKLLDRDLFFFYLGNYSAAKSTPDLLPNLTEDTYIFVRYHELDLYYEIVPKFILTGYLGIERAQGGRFTDWGESDLPRDQTGIGIGGGFDWTVSENTGIYFRYRHMDFEDKNFELDRYVGDEITVELKTFF